MLETAEDLLALMSKAYIAYLDCRRTGGETMKIAACFTQGDSDYLCVGRNGLFYDRQHRDWDRDDHPSHHPPDRGVDHRALVTHVAILADPFNDTPATRPRHIGR